MNEKQAAHLPLWRVELQLEQARRRYKLAEESYRTAQNELWKLKKEVDARRAKLQW